MLAKRNRLTLNASYNYLYKKGKAVSTDSLTMFFAIGNSLKVGFSVSNKCGKAHTRNLLKRRMRAIVREALPSLTRAQIVFVAKPALAGADFASIKQRMHHLLKKASLLAG